MTEQEIKMLEKKFDEIDNWPLTKLSDVNVAIGAMSELYTMVTKKFYHELGYPLDTMYYNYWKDYFFDLRNMTKTYIMCLKPE